MKVRSVASVLLCGLILLMASVPCRAGETVADRADGDLPFQLRFYSFPADGDSTRLIALGTLSTDFLRWKASDSLRVELYLSWEFHSSGRRHARSRQVLRLARPLGEAGRGAQAVITGAWSLPPGHYRVEFRAEDRGGKKGWLPGGLFGKHPRGRWSGRVEARDFQAGGMLSDLLLYSVSSDSLSSPNPWGSFEQGSPYMELYAELTPPAGGVGDWFSLQLEILNPEGESLLERKGGWRVGDRRFPLRFRLPLAGLDPGDYRLRLNPAGPGIRTEEEILPFRVLPFSYRSEKGKRRQEIEARLVLGEEGYRGWSLQPAGEKSETLRRFWAERDPDPQLPGNALREEFRRRYAQAQRRFSGFKPGPLTDMGRLWIRLGEPDEIRVDVMPENSSSLMGAVAAMHGAREGAGPNAEMDRDLARIGYGGLGSPGSESEAFEVWIYRLGGDPLFPEHRIDFQNVDFTLIFVDRSGYGEYELEFSSEKFDF